MPWDGVSRRSPAVGEHGCRQFQVRNGPRVRAISILSACLRSSWQWSASLIAAARAEHFDKLSAGYFDKPNAGPWETCSAICLLASAQFPLRQAQCERCSCRLADCEQALTSRAKLDLASGLVTSTPSGLSATPDAALPESSTHRAQAGSGSRQRVARPACRVKPASRHAACFGDRGLALDAAPRALPHRTSTSRTTRRYQVQRADRSPRCLAFRPPNPGYPLAPVRCLRHFDRERMLSRSPPSACATPISPRCTR